MRTIPIIILEGPDFSGKTTLSQQLVDRWSSISKHHTADIIHTGPPENYPDDSSRPDRVTDDLKDLILRTDTSIKHLTVFDRFHWGMPIYGPLMRPEKDIEYFGDIGFKNFCYIEMLLAQRGAITVHVATPLSVLLERAKHREDDYLDENLSNGQTRADQLRHIHFLYHQFAAFTGQFMPSTRPIPQWLHQIEHSDVQDLLDLNSQQVSPWDRADLPRYRDEECRKRIFFNYIRGNWQERTAAEDRVGIVCELLISSATLRSMQSPMYSFLKEV